MGERDNAILKRVKPNICPLSTYDMPRRMQIKLIHPQIGHCFFSHGFLILRENTPWCGLCNSRITLDHVLIEFPLYSAARVKFNIGNTPILNFLGNPENFKNLFVFLNQIGLLNLIQFI